METKLSSIAHSNLGHVLPLKKKWIVLIFNVNSKRSTLNWINMEKKRVNLKEMLNCNISKWYYCDFSWQCRPQTKVFRTVWVRSALPWPSTSCVTWTAPCSPTCLIISPCLSPPTRGLGYTTSQPSIKMLLYVAVLMIQQTC